MHRFPLNLDRPNENCDDFPVSRDRFCLSIIGLFTGFVFANHMEIGLLISLAVAFAFQTVFFQIAVRAKNGTLVRWRAAVLSLIVILGGFLVASPLIELWERFRA